MIELPLYTLSPDGSGLLKPPGQNNKCLPIPVFDQAFNEDFTFHFFDDVLSFEGFCSCIIYFEIFEAKWPFGSCVLTHSIEVFRHSFIKVITLTNVKRMILQTLKNVNKEHRVIFAGTARFVPILWGR